MSDFNITILNKGEIVNSTYDVQFFIGEGAFGEVYRVKHKFLETQVLKVFKESTTLQTLNNQKSLTAASLRILSNLPLVNDDHVADVINSEIPQMKSAEPRKRGRPKKNDHFKKLKDKETNLPNLLVKSC